MCDTMYVYEYYSTWKINADHDFKPSNATMSGLKACNHIATYYVQGNSFEFWIRWKESYAMVLALLPLINSSSLPMRPDARNPKAKQSKFRVQDAGVTVWATLVCYGNWSHIGFHLNLKLTHVVLHLIGGEQTNAPQTTNCLEIFFTLSQWISFAKTW